jgi:tRNA(Ile)-lysidine synthase
MPSIDISAQLIEQTRQAFSQQPVSLDQPLWVAFSGGCDSHCLLHILCQITHPRHLHVIHINHQLSPNAHQWEQHCQHIATAFGTSFHSMRLPQLADCHSDIEAQARAARYEAFASLLPPEATLIQGHHLNDQAETILMRLLRGSGPDGLAGIPTYRRHKHFQLFRPLLGIPQAQLQQYAQAQSLQWIEDESNQQTRFTRNYIRHDLLPILEKKWPAAVINIARSGQHCVEQNTLIQNTLKSQLATITDGKRLHIPSLLMEPIATQKAIIRSWQKTWSPYPLSSKQMAMLFSSVLAAGIDRTPQLSHDIYTIRRYRDYLYAVTNQPMQPPTAPIHWPSDTPSLTLGYHGITLTRHITQPDSLYQQPLIIRFRQGGERFRPLGHVGSRPVKKLFAIPGYGLSSHPQAHGSITISPTPHLLQEA